MLNVIETRHLTRYLAHNTVGTQFVKRMSKNELESKD